MQMGDEPMQNSDSKRNSMDDVINAYKQDIDRTLLRENLKLTVQERFEKFERFMRDVAELQRAGRQAREKRKS
jgi:hypothetical protein